MIELYQYDPASETYGKAGTIKDGEIAEGDIEWVADFIENTEGVTLEEEAEVIARVSNQYFVGVILDGSRSLLHDSRSESELVQEELVFEDIIERVLWSDDTDRVLFQFDPEEVPGFVIERLEEAVQSGALFSQFESIPDWAAQDVEEALLDSLETSHGWSIDSITENLQSMALGLSDREAEVIARTETQALVNKAREAGYEEQFDLEEERFNWVGPSDNRTTDACEWIKSQIPENGVTLPDLKALVQEAPEHDPNIDTDPREFTPHVQCRHTYTRQV